MCSKRKNRKLDEFGSTVARVHVGRDPAIDQLRPASTLRTALTGQRKRGFERKVSKSIKNMSGTDLSGGKVLSRPTSRQAYGSNDCLVGDVQMSPAKKRLKLDSCLKP
ncbi:unnamed protein product [Protopolystoma xenopodis]|uniref:Uncharacterized protein n=1 Tax=Protopolystoma xenopodis TaxID=117903 RepID=A0A448X1I9_9PLAT|nr:unnamed protein product [Protopolystoma xenopodis]